MELNHQPSVWGQLLTQALQIILLLVSGSLSYVMSCFPQQLQTSALMTGFSSHIYFYTTSVVGNISVRDVLTPPHITFTF